MKIRETIIVMLLAAVATVAGCSVKTHDFLKQIEGKAYDSAAKSLSQYCNNLTGPIAAEERKQAAREMRQRGDHGPNGPGAIITGLDDQTANGRGPVVRIWCEGETVPFGVWESLKKTK